MAEGKGEHATVLVETNGVLKEQGTGRMRSGTESPE